MNHKLNILGTLVFMSLLFSAESHAAIYKCVKANSEVFYNDKPCPVADKETEFNSVKDPENGYIPPAFVEDNTQSGQDVLDYSLIENGQISLDDIKIDKSLKLNIVNSEPMN